MFIKTRARAKVTDDFIETLVSVSRYAINSMTEQIERYDDVQRRHYIKQNAVILKYHKDIANRVTGAGIGIDYEMTRLRSSDFGKVGTGSYHDNHYIIAETKPIIMTTSAHRDISGKKTRGKKWNIGEYRIHIPIKSVLDSKLHGLHLVPLRDPRTDFRHPHHLTYSSERDHEVLNRNPSTCWGSFASPMVYCLNSRLVVEMLFILSAFLRRYNTRDPLRHGFERLHWVEEV